MLLRRCCPADRCSAWGSVRSVQGALGKHRIPSYAKRLAQRIAQVGPRKIHLETSDQDPFLGVNKQLAKALKKKGVPHELLIGRGSHNQTLATRRRYPRNAVVERPAPALARARGLVAPEFVSPSRYNLVDGLLDDSSLR